MLTSSHLKAKSPVQYTKVDDHVGNVNALLNNMPESVLSLIQDKVRLSARRVKATSRWMDIDWLTP